MTKASYTVMLACALTCAGCVAVNGYAPPRFSGQVFDGASKVPIANAQVQVTQYWNPDWSASARSDAAGRFQTTPSRMFLFPVSAIELWTDARIEIAAEGYLTRELTEIDLTKRSFANIVVYLKHR